VGDVSASPRSRSVRSKYFPTSSEAGCPAPDVCDESRFQALALRAEPGAVTGTAFEVGHLWPARLRSATRPRGASPHGQSAALP